MLLTTELFYVGVLLPILVLMLVSALLLWRGTFRQLPLFFFYVLTAWLFGVSRFAAFKLGAKPYFYTYWISELAGAVTVSLALYEVFLQRLFKRFYNVRFYRNLFPLVAGLVLVVAIVTSLHASDKRAAFLTASRGFDFVRTSLLVFFVALVALMGREWSRYDFGIALGFGLQAAIALLNAAVRAQSKKSTFLGVVEIVSYNIACLIWLITFWKPEHGLVSASSDEQISTEALHEAHKWEKALKDFITPGKQMF
jgi:hypothetical protein